MRKILMHRSRLELELGVTLDARHAVWLAATRTLAVADLHLGYAWAHRAQGQMLPLSAEENSLTRLRALLDDYAPAELVLLGDIVHRAVRVKPLVDELSALITELSARTALRLVLGNHDRNLEALVLESGITPLTSRAHIAGIHTLVHGDCTDAAAAETLFAQCAGRVIIGHEHPAITVSDGVATRVRRPCFLVGEKLLVLPAFSSWSSGTEVRGNDFLSAYTRCGKADRAIAVIASRLLPMRV
jgi:DNA ligase-associated metallophosphoesterase